MSDNLIKRLKEFNRDLRKLGTYLGTYKGKDKNAFDMVLQTVRTLTTEAKHILDLELDIEKAVAGQPTYGDAFEKTRKIKHHLKNIEGELEKMEANWDDLPDSDIESQVRTRFDHDFKEIEQNFVEVVEDTKEVQEAA